MVPARGTRLRPPAPLSNSFIARRPASPVGLEGDQVVRRQAVQPVGQAADEARALPPPRRATGAARDPGPGGGARLFTVNFPTRHPVVTVCLRLRNLAFPAPGGYSWDLSGR